MAIPGLRPIPIEVSNPQEVVSMISFNLKRYEVPAAHRYGKCRPITDFEKICRIAEGNYGTVYKVRDKTSKEILALKKLKIEDDSEFMQQNLLREIVNLKKLKHINIINLIDVVVGKHFESTGLVLEYCRYSLAELIDDSPDLLQHPQIKNIMCQLFTGLNYIHKHSIFHRDISPPNILFNDTGTLKISDFNSSRVTTTSCVTPNVGCQWYKAPEILFGSTNYSSSVDIWSAGCIFAEMLLHKALFQGDSQFKIITLIVDLLGTPTERSWPGYTELPLLQDYQLPNYPFNRIRSTFSRESVETVSLLHRTLLYNPSGRMSAEQCLNHSYFCQFPAACSLEDLVRTLKASNLI